MVILNKVQAMLYRCCVKAVESVYDEVPEDLVFPCVVIGDIGASKLECKDDIYRYSVMLNVFSIFNGKKEANEIIENITKLLNKCKNEEIEVNHTVDSVSFPTIKIAKTADCYQGELLVEVDIFEL